MIGTVDVRHGDFVGFLPEEIHDVDRAAFIVNPEDCAQPALAVDDWTFEAQLQPIAATLNFQIGTVRVKRQTLRQCNALLQLAGDNNFTASR